MSASRSARALVAVGPSSGAALEVATAVARAPVAPDVAQAIGLALWLPLWALGVAFAFVDPKAWRPAFSLGLTWLALAMLHDRF